MSQALLSLVELEAYQGHRRPQRSGERLRYFCPIHGSDNQASLSVDPNTGAYHCFACGAHGYLEEHKREWLEEKRRTLNQVQSLPRTRSGGGLWAPSGGQGNKKGAGSHGAQMNTRQPAGAKATGPAKSAQNPVVKYPRASSEPRSRPDPESSSGQALAGLLRELQAALPGNRGEEYLHQRGISLELGQAFGLGYAAPGRWPHRGRDWKEGRLVFPHTHPAGEVVNLYGRAIGSNESVPKEKRHDHLPRPKGIFNAQALRVADTVFICEGVFDALSLMAAGTLEDGWAACAVFGVDGLRWEWVRARRIVFCFDSDEAGKKWQELAWQGVQQGREICFLTVEAYAGHKDLNEAWVATGRIDIGVWEGRRRTPLPRWVDDELIPGQSPSPVLDPEGKIGGSSPWVSGLEASVLTLDSGSSPAGVSPKIREFTGKEPVDGPSGPALKPVSVMATRESLQQRESSSFWMKSDGTCSRCAGRRAWRSVRGIIICATCHPPANPELVAEWIEGAVHHCGEKSL